MGLLPTEIGEPGAKLPWKERSRTEVWNMLHEVPSGGVKKEVGFLSLGFWSKAWDRLTNLGALTCS